LFVCCLFFFLSYCGWCFFFTVLNVFFLLGSWFSNFFSCFLFFDKDHPMQPRAIVCFLFLFFFLLFFLVVFCVREYTHLSPFSIIVISLSALCPFRTISGGSLISLGRVRAFLAGHRIRAISLPRHFVLCFGCELTRANDGSSFFLEPSPSCPLSCQDPIHFQSSGFFWFLDLSNIRITTTRALPSVCVRLGLSRKQEA